MAHLVEWLEDPPALRDPLLLVVLEGFVDAGGVASTAAMFVRHRWQADLIATFDREALIDYRARRPTGVIDKGTLRRVDWPQLELLAAKLDGPRDALLLIGPEPDMRWDAFFDAVVEVCRRLGVAGVVGLGAYPAAAPHTRPIRIMRASNAAARGLGIGTPAVNGYNGPVGAGTALHAALAEHDIPAVGLWAEVPHYIAGSPNPAGALAMVQRCAALLETPIDTTELEAAAKLHAEQVDEAVSEHPEAAAMVTALEQQLDSGAREGELPSGDDIAAEIERFLRSQSD